VAPTGASARRAPDPWDIGFGAVLLAASLAALLVWFPNDITGGFVEAGFGGRREPGDAFFPVLLASALAGLAAVHVVLALLGRGQRPPGPGADPESGRLTPRNLAFFAGFHAIVLAGLALMYGLGPLAVSLAKSVGLVDLDYRQLADSAPWKYLGYLAGGFVMTAGLIALVEGRLRRRAVLTVLIVLALAVLLFDVALTNVQLPPNADQ
jgi:hypothetical protein